MATKPLAATPGGVHNPPAVNLDRTSPSATTTTTNTPTSSAPTMQRAGTGDADRVERQTRSEALASSAPHTPPSTTGASQNTARAGLVRALSIEMLVATRPHVELLSAELVLEARAGRANPAAAVDKALAKFGPLGVAELVAATAWRLDAVISDLTGAEAKALAAQRQPLLDHLTDHGVQTLARRAPSSLQDAVQTMVAQSALLSAGQTAETAYHAPADTSYAHHFDAFTNEPGLSSAIDALPKTGGAVIGVSGAALHTAARRGAEAAVITDINPEVRDFVIVFAATVMALQERAQAKQWSDDKLVDEVCARLVGPERGGAKLMKELAAAGVPEAILARAPRMLAALYNENGMNYRHVWFASLKGKLDPSARAVPRAPDETAVLLRAIATMARQGGLAAAVVDLADPQALSRQNTFLAAREQKLSAVHLSNALDYVLEPPRVLDGIAQLAARPDALVISSCAGHPVDRRIGDWYRPGVTPLSEWLDDTSGVRATLVKQKDSQARLGYRMFESAFLPPPKETPKTIEAVRESFATALSQHYADPDKAYLSLLQALGMTPYYKKAEANEAQVQKLRDLGVPPPHDPEEARSLARRVRHLFERPKSPYY